MKDKNRTTATKPLRVDVRRTYDSQMWDFMTQLSEKIDELRRMDREREESFARLEATARKMASLAELAKRRRKTGGEGKRGRGA